MRKVAAGLFITMDGITEAPNKWQETFDEDMGAAMQAVLEETDTILLGRVTYQEWEPYWPNYKGAESESFATFINTTPKYVISNTLTNVSWGNFDNATLINHNLSEELATLKKQPGKTISVCGSPGLVHSVMDANLLDELTLIIHNVAAYNGKRLFNKGILKRFDLLEAKPTSSGTIIAKYQPRPS
jgi:dihydrofolate reductase